MSHVQCLLKNQAQVHHHNTKHLAHADFGKHSLLGQALDLK